MEFGPGAILAGYRIERRVGGGGMGAVYLAQHPRLPRRDAVKVLDARLAVEPTFRARFEREADLAARLRHPNVVQIFDRGVDGDRLWIAMQFVDGLDAAQLLRQGLSVLTPERAVRIVAEAAKGLDYAHRQGLLHRDIKPANLLIARAEDGTDEVLVTDFGIARSMGETTSLTSAGSVLGTLAYAAPEQLEGQPLDVRTDVYALGGTLYELVTGFVPFQRESPAALISAHLIEPPPRPSAANPALPPALDRVIARAMAKNPDDRYASCGELADAAIAALTGGPEVGETAVLRPSRSRAPRLSPARKVLLGVGGVAAVAAVTVLAVFTTGDRGASEVPATPQAARIGAVPGSSKAAAVLRPWLDDVLAGDMSVLIRKCWTQSPAEIPQMYGDVSRIIDVVQRPGVLGQFGPYWNNEDILVSLRPSELRSEYGCPTVSERWTTGRTDEQARYTVERYLSRVVGDPVNPADVEPDYPLLCNGAQPGTALSGVRRFEDKALTVHGSTDSVVTVDAPVSTADGATSTVELTLDHAANGYCISHIDRAG
ncbi:serine/threonine-protein kinase [Nocardia alba]|uniref:non-specific serine/threonine protein kinase n=1 Tax=Nocardia alba TaxID=225051 RepID=A0A4R1FQU2_9NOCA|nr:serine/threonine-protein kinase [Nocardia alba]TCJ93551.1 serine/threonine protein kinase [Nocardia alba]